MFPMNPNDGPIYSVTIKTDGRRVLACWHETGLYLCSLAGVISRVMAGHLPTGHEIAASDSSDEEETEETAGSDLVGTILDCELIEEGFITEQNNFSLYVFDCMFVRVQGQIVDMREKPLEKRLAMARFVNAKFSAFVANSSSLMTVNLVIKRFIPFVDRASFYEANKTALKMNLRDGVELYKSDGLIFTDLGPYLRDDRPACDCGKKCGQCTSFNASRESQI